MQALQQKYSELLRKSRGDKNPKGIMKGEQPSQHPLDNTSPQGDMSIYDALEIIQTNTSGKMEKTENLHQLYSYKVEGSNHIQYVSDLYLQQRVNNVAEEGKGDRGMEIEEEERGENRKKVRYFDGFKVEEGMRYSKCYRCGKTGHSIKHCVLEQEPIKCMFCLGNHSHNSCNTRSCFQCNQMGHIAKECKNPRSRCSKCGNKGHSESDCGVIIFLNHTSTKLDRHFREKYGCDDIINLRCLCNCKYPVGHYNCHDYLNKQQCYSQAKAEKTIERQKFILSNFNKLRESYFKQKGSRLTNRTPRPLPPCSTKMEEEIECSQ